MTFYGVLVVSFCDQHNCVHCNAQPWIATFSRQHVEQDYLQHIQICVQLNWVWHSMCAAAKKHNWAEFRIATFRAQRQLGLRLLLLLCGLLPDIQRSPVAACSSPLLKTAQKVDTSVALQRLYTKVTCIVWTSTSTHPLSAKAVAIEREIWLISIFTIQSNTNLYLNFLLYKICNLPPHHIFSQDCEHWFDLI